MKRKRRRELKRYYKTYFRRYHRSSKKLPTWRGRTTHNSSLARGLTMATVQRINWLVRGAIATQNRWLLKILASLPGQTGSFSFSEEGEAFFETIFSEKMEYTTQKAKVAKYSQPDSRWTKCPQLDPVVEGILSPEALKQDKVTHRSQETWLEAAGPLAAIQKGASKGNLTLPEVIPMIQTSLVLMGDASLHQSSLRWQTLLQHFNPQLKKLMNEQDLKNSQPFLFGENFCKEKLESAVALQKVIYPQTSKGKTGFQGHKPHRGYGSSRLNNSGPRRGATKEQHQQSQRND